MSALYYRFKQFGGWRRWLQGLENAPELVRVCYDSLCKHITDREIVALTRGGSENAAEK